MISLACLYKKSFVYINSNTVLRRRVACAKSSLLLKIQWKEHHFLYKHGCYMIIITWKVDPCTERGLGILIKESSTKVIGMWQDSGEARLILSIASSKLV